MVKRLLVLVFFIFSLLQSKAEIENNVILFNDSTVNQMKLMSFSMSEKQEVKSVTFISPKQTPCSKDFSSIHSMKLFVKCTDTLKFYLTFTSSGIESNRVLITLAPNHGYSEVSIPFISSTNSSFDITSIDGFQIEWSSSATSYLIDEIAFNYFEPEEEVSKKPSHSELKERLNQEEDKYKKRKRKEGNSDFFKKRKEYESR